MFKTLKIMRMRAWLLVFVIGMMAFTVSGFTTTTTAEKSKIEKVVTQDVDFTSVSVVVDTQVFALNTSVSTLTDNYTGRNLICIKQNLEGSHVITQWFVNDVGKRYRTECNFYPKKHKTKSYRRARDGLTQNI